jgi:hypothetical protein
MAAKQRSLGRACVVATLAIFGTSVRGADDATGISEVHAAPHALRIVECRPDEAHRPCMVAAPAPRDVPAWLAIARAAIRQTERNMVELSMVLGAPVPPVPDTPLLVYYWQFQDGCVAPTPTNKSGVNAVWNGQRWSARWFVITGCNPRRVAPGDSLPLRFDGSTLTVSVRRADLVTRGGEPLVWFAASRLLPFDDERYPRTFPVDTAPEVVALDPEHPDAPRRPQAPARWTPR